MKDDIKEILTISGRYITNDEKGLILDYITNLQQLYDKAIEDDVLESRKRMLLQEENKNLRTELNAYENPDDMTLFYMWLDEKAKDKMKKLQEENNYLKMNSPEQNIEHFRIIKENKRKINLLRKQNKKLQEKNEMYAQLKDEYKDIIDKATEYVNNTIFWGLYEDIPMIDTKYGEDLSNILQGEDNE